MFSHFFTWCIKGLNCQVNSWNVQNSVSVPRRNFSDFLFCKLNKPNPNSLSNFEGVKNQISTLNWQFLSQIRSFCLKISQYAFLSSRIRFWICDSLFDFKIRKSFAVFYRCSEKQLFWYFHGTLEGACALFSFFNPLMPGGNKKVTHT